jgi:hypothetical protein
MQRNTGPSCYYHHTTYLNSVAQLRDNENNVWDNILVHIMQHNTDKLKLLTFLRTLPSLR